MDYKVRKRLALSLLRLSFLIYYVTTISFRLCFMTNFNIYNISYGAVAVDYFVDLFFWINFITDNAASSTVSPSPSQPLAQNAPSSIAAPKVRYRKTLQTLQMLGSNLKVKSSRWKILTTSAHIVLEFLSLLPFELIGYAIGIPNFQRLRVFRLIRLRCYMQYWSSLCEMLYLAKIVQNRSIQRFWILTTTMAVIGHVFACLFYRIGVASLHAGSNTSWLVQDRLVTMLARGKFVENFTLNYRYLRAMYWSIQTLDTIGFGDLAAKNEAETWFCTLYFYIAAYLVYNSIANFITLITSIDSARTKTLIKKARFAKYVKYRMLPNDLSLRVTSYYDYQWQTLKGTDETEVLSELPPNLSQQLHQHVIRDLFNSITSFKELNKGVLNALSDNVEIHVFSPDDIVVDFDSVVTGLHIVGRGEVGAISITGEVLEILRTKDVFGLQALTASFTIAKSYQARSFAEIVFLRGSVYRHIIDVYMDKKDAASLPSAAVGTNGSTDEATKERTSLRGRHSTMMVRWSNSIRLIRRGSSTNDLIKQVNETAASIRGSLKPTSRSRKAWDVLIFAGLIFYFTSVGLLLSASVRQSFLRDMSSLLITSYIVDGIFAVDMLLQARYFGFLEDGVIVLETTRIWQHYWRVNSSTIVLLSIFPFDAVIGFNTTLRILPTLRLLKLLHLRNFNSYMERFFETFGEATGRPVSFELSRFITLYFFLFEVCHWAGCFWILSAEIGVDVFHVPTNWIKQDHIVGLVNVDYKRMPAVVYSRSIYWAASVMSSIGFPDLLPQNSVEMVANILVMFIGYLVFNALLGAIANLIGSFNRDKREFNARVEKMRSLMAYTKMPASIEGRVLRYYEYVWSRFGGVDEKDILASLPKTLRADVVYHVVGPLVGNVPFFADLSEPMEHMLLSLFESRIVLDGDALVIFGDMGKEMFVIEKGIIQVTNADRSIIFATLGAKDYIGESCLLEMTPRTASAYAVGYVDTFFITTDNFVKVAEIFPTEYSMVTNAIEVAIEEKKRKNEALRLARLAAERQEPLENKVEAKSRPGESVTKDDVTPFDSDSSKISSDEKSSIPLQPIQPSAVKSKALGQSTTKQTRPVSNDASDSSFVNAIWSLLVTGDEAVIHPDSSDKAHWDIFIFISLAYYLIMIPLRITLRISSEVYAIDYFFDACNIIDSIFCANIFAVFHGGKVVSNRSQIWRIFVMDRLWIDTMAFLPYDLLALLVLHRSAGFIYFVRALLRIPKLFKVALLSRYYVHVERLVGYMKIHPLLFRFVELTLLFLIVAFYVACGWFLFASHQFAAFCRGVADVPGEMPCKFVGTWVEQQYMGRKLPLDGGSQWTRFIRAINFAIPILTGEIIGDMFAMNEQESFFAFLVMFCGLSINGAIIGSIVNAVSDANEETTRLYRQKEQLRDYLRTNSIPDYLIQTSTAFLSYLISTEGSLTLTRDSMFSELPHALKVDIDQHLKTLPYLRRCPFFDFCSDDILRGIAARLHVQLYTKGDKIISAGDLGHEMFFLQSGTVDVVGGDEATGITVYSTLEEGAFFGETGLFFKKPRVATIVVSSPFCVCLCLRKDDLDHELRSSEYDEEEVLYAFQYLQEMNKRRNTAVSTNLKIAADVKESKLHKMMKQSNESKTSASFLHFLRRHLSPESAFRFVWDTLGLIILLYYIFSIPFFIAYFSQEKLSELTQYVAFEILFNIYWIFDVVLKLFLFPYRTDIISNNLETDGELIFRRYMDSFFWYDVVASIPSEMLILSKNVNYLAIFVLRFCHLIRVSQLNTSANMLEDHLRRRFGLVMGRTAGLVLKAGVVYIILNHWLACGYFMIHRYAEIKAKLTYAIVDGMSTYNPATHRHDICSKTVRYCYARTVYLVMGQMSSVGYGDIQPYTNKEILWQQVVAICGAYIAAIFMGYAGTHQADQDASSDHAFKAKVLDVERYLQFRQVPSNLNDAIVTQYRYLWQKHRSLQGEKHELLALLSAPSKLEIFRHLHREIMETVPVLKDSAAPLKRRISSILHPQIALADSVIYRAGDVGKAVFFVASGEVNITLSTDRSTLDPFGLTALRILLHKEQQFGTSYTAGAHFGEFCLLSKSGLRADNAVAKSATEMYYMVKEDLWEVFLYMTPDIRQDFVYSLMTQVGDVRYITRPAARPGSSSAEAMNHDANQDQSGSQQQPRDAGVLYRLACNVVEKVTEILDEDEEESSSDEESKPKSEQLKKNARASNRWVGIRALIKSKKIFVNTSESTTETPSSLSIQRDRLHRIEGLIPRLPVKKSNRMTFSADALRSRLASSDSIKLDEDGSNDDDSAKESSSRGNSAFSSPIARRKILFPTSVNHQKSPGESPFGSPLRLMVNLAAEEKRQQQQEQQRQPKSIRAIGVSGVLEEGDEEDKSDKDEEKGEVDESIPLPQRHSVPVAVDSVDTVINRRTSLQDPRMMAGSGRDLTGDLERESSGVRVHNSKGGGNESTDHVMVFRDEGEGDEAPLKNNATEILNNATTRKTVWVDRLEAVEVEDLDDA